MSSSVWRAATPFTLKLPTTAKYAMRTIFGELSSIIESASCLPMSLGYFSATRRSQRALISYMICRWRGKSFSKNDTDHFSSASGRRVWLV